MPRQRHLYGAPDARGRFLDTAVEPTVDRPRGAPGPQVAVVTGSLLAAASAVLLVLLGGLSSPAPSPLPADRAPNTELPRPSTVPFGSPPITEFDGPPPLATESTTSGAGAWSAPEPTTVTTTEASASPPVSTSDPPAGAARRITCAPVLVLAADGGGPPAARTPRGRQLIESATSYYRVPVQRLEGNDAADTAVVASAAARQCPGSRMLLVGVGRGAPPARAVLASIRAGRGPIPLDRLLGVSINDDADALFPTSTTSSR